MPPELPFLLATLARRRLLDPGPPGRVARQLAALRRWGFGLPGELRSAAARSPERVALIDDRGPLTYGALLARTERLAVALRGALDIQPGDRIGVLGRNHVGLIELAVAAATVGADPVLVNTGLSGPQLVAVAEEQRLRVLCYDAEFVEIVAALPFSMLRLDMSTVDALVARAQPAILGPPEREGRTIVLTSGTTGTPKGARRRTPDGFGPLASIISRIPLRAGERVYVAAPLFHTWGYAALQVVLALRGTMVLSRRFEPATALAEIVRHDCTALFAVPVMLQRLLEVRPRRTPLRVVAVSGSALPGTLATRFMDAYGDMLYNLYGSTEASWASIATPDELRTAPGTAGRPPHGTRLSILDGRGDPVAPGHVGRIFVGNDMLFEGYTNGAARETHGGLLATGDLGHVDEHGLLHVDGRQDDMIVSGGENVFPSPVEDLISGLPQVREVAVIGVTDAEFGQRLAAYVVLQDGEALDADAIREYVRHYLARFSVPRDVVFLRELPRTPTGKVVARDLPRGR